MEDLKAKWNSLGLFGKIGLALISPLLLFALFSKALSGLRTASDQSERKKVDGESVALDVEKAKTDAAMAHSEGKLEELKTQEQDALKEGQNESPTDFFNGRDKPPGK